MIGEEPASPESGPVRRRPSGAVLWFAALAAAICLEGLGRKLLPQVPAIGFYFLKDLVLLAGLLLFGIRGATAAAAARLYGGFWVPLLLAMSWTAIEIFNPAQPAPVLGLIGLRSYWLWWLAPLVVASVLRDSRDRRQAVMVLAGISVVVAAYATAQFAAPADSPLNAYARYQGTELLDAVATVESTERVRVSSTFAYISGFTDFVIIVPALLLSLGLGEPHGATRSVSLVGALLSAAVLPMSGSRAPVVLGILALAVVAWRSGHVGSRSGRRVLLAGVALLAAGSLAAPEALRGVQDRFGYSDTGSRFVGALQNYVPPLALAQSQFPLLGLGTGMEQNARFIFGVGDQHWPLLDEEPGRLLVELGLGYLLVWAAKLGLAVAFLRAARRLRQAGRRELSGAALVLAVLSLQGNLVFDHVWQALNLVAGGLILQAVVEIDAEQAAAPAPGVLAG